ncbi:Olfactory receptor 2M3 [Lemmus lemmus]
MDSYNQTFTGFILLGLFPPSQTGLFLFILIVLIFLTAWIGNLCMILLILLESRLHTPMYFLLSQLSFIDLNYISTIVPKMVSDFMFGTKYISFIGCGFQIFLFLTFGGAECFLLATMAYDRYVAICQPLRYPILMSHKICGLMAASSWILGSLDGIIEAAAALSFSYCGAREIPHFFCDVPALLTLSCSDTLTFEKMIFFCCVIMLIFPVTIIIASYTRVILAVIRMSSAESRHKAFATCSSHLVVVGMYYGAAMFIYMRPSSGRSPNQDKMVSAFYTILTPLLNPLIYSLRNREVARAFMKVLGMEKAEV